MHHPVPGYSWLPNTLTHWAVLTSLLPVDHALGVSSLAAYETASWLTSILPGLILWLTSVSISSLLWTSDFGYINSSSISIFSELQSGPILLLPNFPPLQGSAIFHLSSRDVGTNGWRVYIGVCNCRFDSERGQSHLWGQERSGNKVALLWSIRCWLHVKKSLLHGEMCTVIKFLGALVGWFR